MLLYRIPAVIAGKDIYNGILLCLLAAELPAPRHTGYGIYTGAGVPVFSITGTLLIGCIIPVMPSFRQDMTAQLASEKNSCGIRAPWSPKIYPFNAVGSGESASVENISEFMVLNRGGSSYIGILLAVYMTSLKPCCCRSENKIGCPLYVALLVILTARLVGREKRILVAQQPAVAEYNPVTISMNCYCLPTGPALFSKVMSSAVNPEP